MEMENNQLPPYPDKAEQAPVTYHDLLVMDGQQLLDYIRTDLAQAEVDMFGPQDAEAKLAFSGGTNTDDRDISKLKTVEGETVYKTPPKYVKIDEVEEFLVMANFVINEGFSMTELVAEAADLFYNYSRLMDLDTHPHAPDYQHIMGQIAGALGWSQREALLVAAVKFHRRFVDRKKKDPAGEKELLEGLLRIDPFQPDAQPEVATPSIAQADAAFRAMVKIKTKTIEPRYNQVRYDKESRSETAEYPVWN